MGLVPHPWCTAALCLCVQQELKTKFGGSEIFFPKTSAVSFIIFDGKCFFHRSLLMHFLCSNFQCRVIFLLSKWGDMGAAEGVAIFEVFGSHNSS